jgi:hypothetical protein
LRALFVDFSNLKKLKEQVYNGRNKSIIKKKKKGFSNCYIQESVK